LQILLVHENCCGIARVDRMLCEFFWFMRTVVALLAWTECFASSSGS
jgi:hypothetical protein